MIHICLFTRDLSGGGIERTILNLATGFCDREYQVDLVLIYPVCEFLIDDIPDELSIFILTRQPGLWDRIRRYMNDIIGRNTKIRKRTIISGRARWSNKRLALYKLPRLLFRLLTETHWPARDLAKRQRRADFIRTLRFGYYLQERKPDIVFACNSHADVAGFFASLISDDHPPVIPSIHSMGELGAQAIERTGRLLRRASHAIAVSNGLAKRAAAGAGLPIDRITTIYNPIWIPNIADLASEDPAHAWLGSDGVPVVLSAARLSPEKDLPTLLGAFRYILAERPCRLIILGDGPMRTELEERIRLLGIGDFVSLPGWTTNPYAFMARSRLFVLSSQYEGFGNVLVEAMACGCPVVSTDCPSGPAEILEDPSLLAPVGDPEALAQVMLRALDRPVDRAMLRAKAERFSLDRAVESYETLIADILAERNYR